MKTKQTFSSLMDELIQDHEPTMVFEDFLTVAIDFSGNKPIAWEGTVKSVDKLFEKYKDETMRFHFAKLHISLIEEVLNRDASLEGNDILGEYYESRLLKLTPSKPLMPYESCRKFAEKTINEARVHLTKRPYNFLDYSCGTGRMLLAASKIEETVSDYFGVDSNPTYVKIVALNLFLNGFTNSELLCRNRTSPGDFQVSYIVSRKPSGIFPLRDKKESLLWHMLTETPLGNVPFSKRSMNFN